MERKVSVEPAPGVKDFLCKVGREIVGFATMIREADPNISEAGLRGQGLAQARQDEQARKHQETQ